MKNNVEKTEFEVCSHCNELTDTGNMQPSRNETMICEGCAEGIANREYDPTSQNF